MSEEGEADRAKAVFLFLGGEGEAIDAAATTALSHPRYDAEFPPLYVRHRRGGHVFVAWLSDKLPPTTSERAREHIEKCLADFEEQGKGPKSRWESLDRMQRAHAHIAGSVAILALLSGAVAIGTLVVQTLSVRFPLIIETLISAADETPGILPLAVVAASGLGPIIAFVARGRNRSNVRGAK